MSDTTKRSNRCPLRHDLSPKLTKIDQLRPPKRQLRVHPKSQIKKLADSLANYGFAFPILLDSEGRVLAGWALVQAALGLELESIPTVTMTELTDEECRGLAIALNRLAEESSWSREQLALEIGELGELGFDLESTGFEIAEIELIFDELGSPAKGDAPEDDIPSLQRDQPATTRPLDTWKLGQHQLHCGNALEQVSYEVLMGEERARVGFSDPPYNVAIPGHVSGLGRLVHGDFAMGSGEMDSDEFVAFLHASTALMARYSVDGSLHFVCMDWRHLDELLQAANPNFSGLKNICVWNKDNAGMGSLYRSKHEFVCVFKSGREPHLNNVQLGRFGRYRTNVWDYPGVNSLHEGRMEELAMHPTVKPVALVADAILDCSRRGDLVLDPFVGSGTTIIAAERTTRRARAIEIDPHYCDVAIRRWQDFTGEPAIHQTSRLSFQEMADKRSQSEPLEEVKP